MADRSTPQTGPFDARYAFKWTTLSPVLAVLIVVILTLFDPFGFESATKRQSAIIIYKIYATLYPDKIRDNISVVLLDDATLQNWKGPWPPSHRLHAEVLSTLLSFEPAAVLIDIVFLYARQGDYFERTEDVITKAKTPLLMITAETMSVNRQWKRQLLRDVGQKPLEPPWRLPRHSRLCLPTGVAQRPASAVLRRTPI